MDAVAVRTVQPLPGVGAGVESGHLVILFVARQTLLIVRARGCLALERDDLGLVASSLNMSLAGTVAGFAWIRELIGRAFFQNIVSVGAEGLDQVLVAGSAILHRRAGLLRLGPCRQPLEVAGKRHDGQNRHEGEAQEFGSAIKRHFGLYRAWTLDTEKAAVSW